MIDDNIKIHDKFQFELKLSYMIDFSKKYTNYDIEFYLFIPSNLDINSNTYSKKNFYNDLKNYIRFKTPIVNLRNLKNHYIFVILKTNFKYISENILNTSKSSIVFDEFEQNIKIFGMIFRASLVSQTKFILNNTKTESNNLINKLIIEYINEINSVLSKFRNLENILLVPSLPEKFIHTYNFVNEFISISTETNTYFLLEKLKKKKISNFNKIKKDY